MNGSEMRADIVVVGSGAAGAPVAARLSADPGLRVVLIEAGPVPHRLASFPPDLLDAGLIPGAWSENAPVWERLVELAQERPYVMRPGRFLGGSTTVNGGAFVRARRSDFDRWAAAGGAAWGYDRVLPFLRRLEHDLDFGGSALHGGDGPVAVRRSGLEHPAAAAFVAAARDLGFPAEPDKNDQGAPGIGPVPAVAVDGVRGNAGLWYLLDALGRPNLTVRGGCPVRRVVIRRGRAVGVEIDEDGRRVVVAADEVVLCAGALASPQLLMVSGIGPARELRALGIPVVLDAPGVGARISDHPQVVVSWRPVPGLPGARDGWLGAGLHLASAGSSAGDLEILQSLTSMPDLVAGRPGHPGSPLPFLVTLQGARSRGRLRLASADPAASARIDYGYLADSEDRRAMREAVRVTLEVVASDAFRDVSLGVVGPGLADLADDHVLDAWIRANLGSAVHACGSVPMGPAEDPFAVVDAYGRVRGVAGLRVADTSILPDAPLRGPAATAVLIGEVVADAIRRGL